MLYENRFLLVIQGSVLENQYSGVFAHSSTCTAVVVTKWTLVTM